TQILTRSTPPWLSGLPWLYAVTTTFIKNEIVQAVVPTEMVHQRERPAKVFECRTAVHNAHKSHLSADTVAKLYGELAAAHRSGRSRFTDKLKINCLYIGFITRVLPQAKIVSCDATRSIRSGASTNICSRLICPTTTILTTCSTPRLITSCSIVSYGFGTACIPAGSGRCGMRPWSRTPNRSVDHCLRTAGSTGRRTACDFMKPAVPRRHRAWYKCVSRTTAG